MNSIANSRLFLIVLLIVAGVHSWENRYYLRFIPVPLNNVDLVDNNRYFIPAFQDGKLNGHLDLNWGDITTDDGLRLTLNKIRNFSPLERGRGYPDYKGITFSKWLAQAKAKTLLCTDATMLFIIAAWAQGLKAREWHLLPPGWPPGGGHSVAEFFNPKTQNWQVVDAQHAAIVRDQNSNDILSMTDILKRFKSGIEKTIKMDYGPYADHFTRQGRPSPTATYFFEMDLLLTPVLQLRQATWFATYNRNMFISGHFVLGYPIYMDNWTHDSRVLTSKLSLFIFFIAGLILSIQIVKRIQLYRKL